MPLSNERGSHNAVEIGVRDQLSDLLTSHFAEQQTGEFLIAQNDNELVWVDLENQALYLLTIREAEARVNG